MRNRLVFLFLCLCIALECLAGDYGVDYSFPIHRYLDKKTNPFFSCRYEKTLKGCYDKFSRQECDATERARMEMNLAQPKTQHNYTELGFKKVRVPVSVFDVITKFYEQNKHAEKEEKWGRGYTYVNYWDTPSTMISFEDRSFRGGEVVKQQIWDGVKPIIEEWVGHKIYPTSLYGIRVYKDRSILATHVDRLPLVSSCIIQVDQELNEPWPIEVYDHAGKAHNVTMAKGDMVLYESSTVLHGRPFPMNGSHYANIFVHFKPYDHDDMNQRDFGGGTAAKAPGNLRASSEKKPSAKPNSKVESSSDEGGHEQSNHDEETVRRHADQIQAEMEQRRNPNPPPSGQKKYNFPNLRAGGADEYSEEDDKLQDLTVEQMLRNGCASGDVDAVQKLIREENALSLVNTEDSNGWQPIHEAIRGGHVEVVKYLIDMGAEIGHRVHVGGSSLWVAKQFLEPDHELVKYLIEIGAPEDGDEL